MHLRIRPLLLALPLVACGDNASNTGGGSDTQATSVGTLPPMTTANSSGDGSGSGSGDTEGTATAGQSDSSTPTSGASAPTTGGGPKFDLGVTPDGGALPCGGGGDGMPKFSYIWISNSPEGTVSKINTFTGVEEGRYVAGPGNPDPSRTSVNLLGDAAVVDRNGGIMKVAAEIEDCVDKNGNGAIETSNGPGNVLPWGSDECVLWHLPLPSSSNRGPRPVAWEGQYDADTCTASSARVWVGHYDQTQNLGHFYRLDGATGQILDQLQVNPWSGQSYGPYGGAVNKAGDFWVLGWNSGPLIKIDAVTLQVSQWPTPGGAFVYGFAVDKDGNPWAAGSNQYHRFNVQTETWQTWSPPEGGSMRGLQVDVSGRVWIAEDFPCGVHQVDVVTGNHMGLYQIPGCSQPVGVSIDVEGYVWVVDQSASVAFKVDPDGPSLALTATGLVGPYTYSDMTGAGLNLVVGPQG